MSSSFRYTSSSGPFTGDAEDGEEEDEEAEEERCRIPRGKDRLTWLIENLAYHFEATKRVYGFVKDACTPKSCPSMTAGPQYEYLWMDEVGYSRPTRLAACKYISRLFHHWCDLILLDHTFGPPQGCEELLGTVFRRLFRVYGHVYYSHLRKIVARRKEAELNRYFKRLVLFAWHHKLIPPSEMEPLQSLINTLLCIKPYCYLATGTGLVAAHAYRRATFTLQAVERNHSAIGSGGDRLTCHLKDLNGSTLSTYIKDNRDGTYAVTYLPTEPGRFSFHFSSLTKTKVVAEGFRVQVFPSLASDLIKVLTEEQFVDVTFKAGDTRNAIKAHKMIINARLKGFEILNIIDEIQLSSSVRETTFREFIKYIYTGYVDTRNMKNYMLAELLLMAKNYGLEVLEKALERMDDGGNGQHEEDYESSKKRNNENDDDDEEDDSDHDSDEDDEQEEEEEKDEDDEGDEDEEEEDSAGSGIKQRRNEKGIEGLGYGSDGETAEAIQTGYDGDEGYNDHSVHNRHDRDSDESDSDSATDRRWKKKNKNKKQKQTKKKRKDTKAHLRRSSSRTTKTTTAIEKATKKKKRREAINDFSYRDHGSDFEKCINSWKFSDFIFSIYLVTEKDGERNVPVRNIYTHKLFLFSRSGFFRDLFNVYRDLRKTNIIIREDRAVVGPGVTTEESGKANSGSGIRGAGGSNELVMSEEKKNFIYVPSYFVFLVFLKWVYTDVVDLDLADSEHMAKLLHNPHIPRAEPEEEERTMSDLLFLARKFKAVGLIAILIQDKNQKEKKKRELQRASELAARGQQQSQTTSSSMLDTSSKRNGNRAHRNDSGPSSTSHHHGRNLQKKKSGSKLKTGTSSRTEKLKKFIASSPSNLGSSGGVPTRYPYGEMSASTTAQGTTAGGSSAKVTYPYGEMASPSPAPSLSASLSPNHQPLRLAYDSDDDDSAIELKKANAAAAAVRKTGKAGGGGGQRGGSRAPVGAVASSRERAEANSGEYRTGIMRLVASSNSPAPASPLPQESPYAGLAPNARSSSSLLAPPPVAFHPPTSSPSSSTLSSTSTGAAALPVFAIPSIPPASSSLSLSSLLRPPPTSFATSPYAPPAGSLPAPSSSDIRSADDARPTGQTTSSSSSSSSSSPLFSLPAYTPAPFSVPATTIQQGSAKIKSPRRSPPSSSPLYSLPQPRSVNGALAPGQPPASPYSPPATADTSSSLLGSMSPSQHPSHPVRTRAFSIPTLVIEDTSSSSPSTTTTTSSSSSSLLSSSPAATAGRTGRGASNPLVFSLPSGHASSGVAPAAHVARPAGSNGHDRLAIPRPSQFQARSKPAAPPPSSSSAGYSDLDDAPLPTFSSPFPPPAHFNMDSHRHPSPTVVTNKASSAPHAAVKRPGSPLASPEPASSAQEPSKRGPSTPTRQSPSSSPSSLSANSPSSPRLAMPSTSPRGTAGATSATAPAKPKRSPSPSASYAASATSVPSSATTAGLGSSPFKSSLKSSHSRNHSAPGLSSLDSIGSGAAQHQDEAQASFLKNGRVTLLTSQEKKKRKSSTPSSPKSRVKGVLKSSKKDKKASKERSATADASISSALVEAKEAAKAKTKRAKASKVSRRDDIRSSNSNSSSASSTSKEGKATSKAAEKKGKQKLELNGSRGGAAPARLATSDDDDEDEEEDAEEEAEVEIEASDDSEDDDADGGLHHRKDSCIVKAEDVRLGQDSHVMTNNLKHNWRDSL